MAIFSRSKNVNHKVAIFDIGGSSIGVALVNQERNKNGSLEQSNIEWSTRLPIKHENLTDFQSFERDNHYILKSLSNLLWQKNNKEPVADIHCFLSSPWLITEINKLSLEDKQGIFLNQKILNNLTNQSTQKCVNYYKNTNNTDFTVVDNVILQTLIDGYLMVSTLDNKKAKTLKANHFLSLAEKNTLAKIKNIISSNLHQKEPYFHSNYLSNFAVTKSALKDLDDLIILDVSGEITDVISSNHGTISHIGSFPFGKNSLIRSLSNDLNINPNQTYNLLKLYSADQLYSSEKNKLVSIIEKSKKEWQFHLEEVINNNYLTQNIESLVVIVDDPISVLFGKWAEEVPTQDVSCKIGDHELYADLCHKSNPPTKDIGLLIAYLFVSEFM